MNNFLVLLKKEIIDLKQLKNMILLAVFVFFAAGTPIMLNILPMIIMASGNYGKDALNVLPKMSLANVVSTYSGGISQLGILAITFIFGGAIAEERSRGTTALILVKSVNRTAYFLSKIIFAFILCLLLSIISFIILAYSTWVFMPDFSMVDLSVSLSLLFVFNSFVAIMSVELSAVFKKQITAGACAMIVSLLLGLLPMVIPERGAVYIPSRLYQTAINAASGNFIWNDVWPGFFGVIAILSCLFIVSNTIFSKAEL
jgi:ABC-type transport system involved in multi-copper enzyme maturation permease subunit